MRLLLVIMRFDFVAFETKARPLHVRLPVSAQFWCRDIHKWHMPLLLTIFVAEMLISQRTPYSEGNRAIFIQNRDILMLFLPLLEQKPPGWAKPLRIGSHLVACHEIRVFTADKCRIQ